MSIYQDEIMDHYRNPRNYGCEHCHSNASSRMHNPSCGDKIEVRMCLENGVIKDICFEGYGCALSTASASMLTEYVKGKKSSSVQNIEVDQLLSLLNIEVTSARLKCALLPLQAIRGALGKK